MRRYIYKGAKRSYFVINMRGRFNFAAFSLLLLCLSLYVFADFAGTTVYFTVPVSLSFTVTLPGTLLFSSNTSAVVTGYTSDVQFNSTVPTNLTSVPPCVAGGACQSAATPIFQYDNTGTVPINISLKFNASLPTGISVTANSTLPPLGQDTYANVPGRPIPLNGSLWAPLVNNLPFEGANVSNVWLYANFTAYTGTQNVGLIHNSSLGAG